MRTAAMVVNRKVLELNLRDNSISPAGGKELHAVCAVAGQLERVDIRTSPSAREGTGMLVRWCARSRSVRHTTIINSIMCLPAPSSRNALRTNRNCVLCYIRSPKLT